jgi:hypothetical protein
MRSAQESILLRRCIVLCLEVCVSLCLHLCWRMCVSVLANLMISLPKIPYTQGYKLYICMVLTKAGMGHTDLRDVQYGKIRIKYAQYAYNTVPYFMQFRECQFLTQNGPDSPRNHQ